MESRLTTPKAPILLYAEDEDDTAFLFCAQFQKLAPSWEIVHTRDGAAAADKLANAFLPKALVTDLNMPRMNGMELIEWVKGQAQFRSLPIVVRSNSGDPSDRQRCAAMGVSSYLDKPGSLAEIQSQIRFILKLCEGSDFSLTSEIRNKA